MKEAEKVIPLRINGLSPGGKAKAGKIPKAAPANMGRVSALMNGKGIRIWAMLAGVCRLGRQGIKGVICRMRILGIVCLLAIPLILG